MKKENNYCEQTIYIAIDDSGHLSEKEKIAAFGGIILFPNDIENFIFIYEALVNKIKCLYCKEKRNCQHNCPELKKLSTFRVCY